MYLEEEKMALDSGSSNHQRFRTGCQGPIVRYVVLEFVSLSVLADSEVQTVSALLYELYFMSHVPCCTIDISIVTRTLQGTSYRSDSARV